MPHKDRWTHVRQFVLTCAGNGDAWNDAFILLISSGNDIFWKTAYPCPSLFSALSVTAAKSPSPIKLLENKLNSSGNEPGNKSMVEKHHDIKSNGNPTCYQSGGEALLRSWNKKLLQSRWFLCRCCKSSDFDEFVPFSASVSLFRPRGVVRCVEVWMLTCLNLYATEEKQSMLICRHRPEPS